MFSFGATPYGELDSLAVADAMRRGQRLARPKHCTRAVYDVLVTCMRVAVLDRPLFGTLEDAIATARDSEFDAVQATLLQASQPSHDYEYEADSRSSRPTQHEYEYEADAVRETNVDRHEYEYEAEAPKAQAKPAAKVVDLNALFGTGATSA